MPHLLVLLKSKCVYCRHLKLHPGDRNRIFCKLRLVEYGLVKDADELDAITLETTSTKIDGVNGHASEDDSEDQANSNLEVLQRRQNEHVRRTLKKHGGKRQLETIERTKVESISESRRFIIKELFAACTRAKYCGTCKG